MLLQKYKFHENTFEVSFWRKSFRRRHGPLVRASGLHAVDPGSNPILSSGLDLFLIVQDSTLLCFVNRQLVTSCQLGFLINHVSVKFELFLSNY